LNVPQNNSKLARGKKVAVVKRRWRKGGGGEKVVVDLTLGLDRIWVFKICFLHV
jgi:hypothetical protein